MPTMPDSYEPTPPPGSREAIDSWLEETEWVSKDAARWNPSVEDDDGDPEPLYMDVPVRRTRWADDQDGEPPDGIEPVYVNEPDRRIFIYGPGGDWEPAAILNPYDIVVAVPYPNTGEPTHRAAISVLDEIAEAWRPTFEALGRAVTEFALTVIAVIADELPPNRALPAPRAATMNRQCPRHGQSLQHGQCRRCQQEDNRRRSRSRR